MKKIISVFAMLFLLTLLSACKMEHMDMGCGDPACSMPSDVITTKSSKVFDQAVLKKLSDAVYLASQSSSCQRGDQWGIAGIGAKPCGGPAGYIAYKKENAECFLKVLDCYNKQAQEYNRKYAIGSDCMVEPAPKSVVCEEGKPVLVY
ncbi:hypothetical protein IQ13_4159 [Lacibacter cauensis]|uniref:Lipoprotein n=1 Tax=Lacibacter cauensis TaxID=510947 RepID=A0A562S992_9BACT|nr:hypothetical protein [Lacibacter cauensis]TWI77919.1 hypothetical protein IQ13_4159 [Lacibacter cauensis]